MDRDSVIAQLKRTALANEGEPVDEKSFYAQTRLSKLALQKAGFVNYGDAVEAAGFQRNKLNQAFSDVRLFEPLAELTRHLGKFPTTSERQVEHFKNSAFPSHEAYQRRAKKEPLIVALLNWCRTNESYQDVLTTLELEFARQRKAEGVVKRSQVVNGYVYLMRYGAHGKDYKIGSSENVPRRHAQLDMMLPTDVKQIHVVETEDPKGIEKYWHERFADRRI